MPLIASFCNLGLQKLTKPSPKNKVNCKNSWSFWWVLWKFWQKICHLLLDFINLWEYFIQNLAEFLETKAKFAR